MKPRLVFAAFLAALILPVLSHAQTAETFPSRTVRIVTPVTPGGSPDVLARVIAEKLQEAWKEPVIVENKPGVGGNLGAEYVAKSTPDGYTLLVAPNNVMVMNPHLIKAASPARNLAPIMMVAKTPFVLTVHSSVPARSVKELIALAKAKPGELNFGSPGSGQPQHLAGELFNALAGTQIVHVPYRGAVPAVTDLLAGRIQVWFGAVNTLLPHVKAGTIRTLGSLAAKRYHNFPEIPTLGESGVPGFDVDVWIAAMAPAGVPPELIAKIRGAIAAALSQKDVQERLSGQGLEVALSTTEELRQLIQADYARYGKLVRDVGIRPE